MHPTQIPLKYYDLDELQTEPLDSPRHAPPAAAPFSQTKGERSAMSDDADCEVPEDERPVLRNTRPNIPPKWTIPASDTA